MRDSSPPMTAWGQNPKLPHCNSNGRFHLNERTFRTVPLVRTAQVQSGGGVPGAPLSVLPPSRQFAPVSRVIWRV
jgi:hypothetical protein